MQSTYEPLAHDIKWIDLMSQARNSDQQKQLDAIGKRLEKRYSDADDRQDANIDHLRSDVDLLMHKTVWRGSLDASPTK
jgi:hypothetical protein